MKSAYEALREQIVAGNLPPGAPLIESSLADYLGVSRTPVREALRQLEQDGLVERVNRRLLVRERSPGEILEIFELRVVLEGTAARLAAEQHADIDRVRMHGDIHRMEKARGGKPEIQAALNLDFHRSVWQASHNRTLVDVLERLTLYMCRYPFTTYQEPGRVETSLEEHQILVAAILDRDGERAEDIARHHMKVARDIRLKNWERDRGSMCG